MCELLVGLGDVEVLGVGDEAGAPLRVHMRRRAPRPGCGRCGGALWSDGEREVELVDLPAFGRPARLVWHKRRWRCGDCDRAAGTVTEQDRDAWHAKETLRSIYDITDTELGAATVEQLAADLQDPGLPPEINRLGRTLRHWRTPIANWHAARITNAATEAANNLVKRVKRAAFGFTNFANYRIRTLLYAGKPNRALLDTLTPT